MVRGGYHIRGFTFRPTQFGGLDIEVDHGHKAIHLGEEELYEMLAVCGLSADEVEEEDDDVASLDALEGEDEELDEEF